MRSTKIVTSFIQDNQKLLILKRSNKVKTMKGLWAGVSGIIEKNEEPLDRAKIEIYEETGIFEDEIKLLRVADVFKVNSPQYENHEWEIYGFLFGAKNLQIKLNWENSEYRWIEREELQKFSTVPSLEKVLFNLL
ncbi:MAG: hydrolase [Nitrosarchaeum sp.]|jgi:8-oxo-dGTP pyrophosphatase MutT (NUDIX family)|nr:hydrolase [Nitrosarchaeum sp.]